MTTGYRDLLLSPRILLGPGPSMADPRVLRALGTSLLGQFDPEFTRTMDEVVDLCRRLFQTANPRTFPVPGTARSALEAALVSLIEPGDRVVVGECGRFGLLLIEIAERCGATVVPVRAPWGRIVEPDAIGAALRGGGAKLVCLVHGETSTGVLQPLAEVATLCRAHDALLVVDAVLTLGGCEVATDAWGIDVCVAGAQKCLSCPAGISPITYNARAEAALQARRSKVRSNYLDLTQLQAAWDKERLNHHTPPTAMVYGLREALRAAVEEGPEARFARHRLHGRALAAGLRAMGLALFGEEPEGRRTPMLTPVVIPDGVSDVAVRRRLLEDFGIEIGAAFGPLQGKLWRIGTLGYSAQKPHILLCLASLEATLRRLGCPVPPGAGVEAAAGLYGESGAEAPVGQG